MKLASYNDRSRDGKLVVVARDLTCFTDASAVASTLQSALDRWNEVEPDLRALAQRIEQGQVERNPFDAGDMLAPLPRAYQWADGSAYVNHVELVRKARGAEMPAHFWTDPLIYQGGSDHFLPPTAPILMPEESWGIDFEAEIVVVTSDVAMGSAPQQTQEAIRLLGLINDISLRALIKDELSKGFGFFQSKPASCLSPVMVTPDELGPAWDGKKLQLPLHVDFNDRPFGRAYAGTDMTFDFPTLIAHAAKTRALAAGTIIGSGTVSNRGSDGGPGQPIELGGVGYSCLAELRMIETLQRGAPTTPFMRFGDRVRIEMFDADRQSIFGAIDQQLKHFIPQANIGSSA